MPAIVKENDTLVGSAWSYSRPERTPAASPLDPVLDAAREDVQEAGTNINVARSAAPDHQEVDTARRHHCATPTALAHASAALALSQATIALHATTASICAKRALPESPGLLSPAVESSASTAAALRAPPATTDPKKETGKAAEVLDSSRTSRQRTTRPKHRAQTSIGSKQ